MGYCQDSTRGRPHGRLPVSALARHVKLVTVDPKMPSIHELVGLHGELQRGWEH